MRQDGGVLTWMLVLLCAGTGSYCAARFCLRRTAPPADRAADATEAVMALGMAAMAVGLRAPTGLWVGVFGSAAFFSLAVSTLARGHRAHHVYHVVGHAAMVYMALVMGLAPAGGGSSDGMAGMVGTGASHGVPVLTGALLVTFLVLAVRFGLRLVAPVGGQRGGTLLHAPALPDACRVVMGLSMATMLALM
ncbi:hypothetical protein ABIA32_002197 [Streptacidiphilus sp. MAP12-20]|uniref:DUF5134 domain-containing protein n=1 Tax=Streptacidiphilus sp. MAP12-20 TaxID=3156299 RepID=UPI00351572D0